MMSDLIIDFDNSLRSGHVYLVEVEMPWQDHPDEAPNSISADVYVVAANYYQAQYIVQTMYPDALGVSVYEEPINEYEYAARRNRGIL
jgi:hypothetical protein